MADEEGQAPSSPPLPKKGSYNIDFDALDDSINPFESKVKLGSSPPISSGISAASNLDEDLIDPFKPQTKLADSPPGSPKLKPHANNSSLDNGDQGLASPRDTSDLVGDTSAGSSALDDSLSGDAKKGAAVTPKKKKVVKKPKAQSKIKLPKKVKPPQDNGGDVQIFIPGLEDNDAQGGGESIAENPPAAVEVQDAPLPEKIDTPEPTGKGKVKGSKGAKNTAQESTESMAENLSAVREFSELPLSEENLQIAEPKAKAKGKGSKGGKKKVPVNEVEEDEPHDAAPEAMVSSSEIDHQFVDHDDIDETELANEGFAPSVGAFDGAGDWDMLQKFGGGGEEQATEVGDESLLRNFDPLVSSQQEKLAKPSATPEKAISQQPGDENLLAVNSPVEGTQAEAGSAKHPAVRALDAAQADSNTKATESKNESSSEESQFYDAYEYPPGATTKSKLGQKNSSAMEKGPNYEEGGDSKGTVVQLVQVLRYSQSDWNKMKQEMELNFQASLLNKEREWSLMLAERDKKMSALEEANRKVKQTNEDMRMVVAEFEKTISQLQADKERSKSDLSKTTQALESERDQAIEDLQSVETAFSDLHRRYEKSKSIIEGFKRNEEQLKMCVEDLQNKLKKSEGKLQSLRSQAEEKLDRANEDIEKIKKSTKSDIVRLEAALKKAELRISSLEESLQRKEKENQELTAICDELIAKVGS